MTDFDWKKEILIWTDKKRKIKPFQTDLIDFFEKSFINTSHPEKSLFGTNDYSISLLTGGIFFIAYTKVGVIWLLLDKQFTDIPNSQSRIVKSTKNFSEPLFWLETEDYNNIQILINRAEIWESFKNATDRIFENKIVTAHKDHIAKNKILLSDFFGIEKHFIPLKSAYEIETEFQEKVKKAKEVSKKKRQEILAKSNPKPTKTVVTQTVFNRNQYVIVEVLERAKGVCEKCNKNAPFLKDSDNLPYLEVHHIKPLAEDGEDTVENTIALCPNCHRKAHYGKTSH